VKQSTRNPIQPPTPTDGLPIPQPAKAIMAGRRYGNDKLARNISKSPQRTSRVINGYVNASDAFMKAVSQALDRPVEDLFRPGGRHGF
jgi:hypothetical protein